MEAKTKKYLLYGGIVAVGVIVYFMVTSSGASAATPVNSARQPVVPPNTQANTNAQMSQQFDSYISQARAYANKQSGLKKTALNGIVDLANNNKSAIIASAINNGTSISTELAPIFSGFGGL